MTVRLAISGKTHFAGIPSWAARLILAAVLGMLILPFATSRELPGPNLPAAYNDSDLYRDISGRVQAGQNYYAAAELEQRQHGYPTGPAFAIHEPTLSVFLAALRTDAARRGAALALVAIMALGLRKAVERTEIAPALRLPATLLMTTGAIIAWWPTGVFMQELWAGPFIALSLAVHRPGRWGLSLVLALVACLIRELALPYLAVMAVFALAERRWTEAAAWVLGAMAFCAVFALHLAFASGHHLPGDAMSQGWLSLNGWTFVVATAKRNAILLLGPDWLASVAATLGLIGLVASRDRWVMRCALVVWGYCLAFLFVGRPDNAYWGDLYGPLLPLGWVLAPAALADLVKRAAPGGMLDLGRRRAVAATQAES